MGCFAITDGALHAVASEHELLVSKAELLQRATRKGIMSLYITQQMLS
jgi:hypothetical protein